ncbi:class I SAM-dependent methyltransferase [Oceanimonas sp. CHS3-5]|uniref:class I SAM-dependent methyltransferase n=1 Tax=Oceanimonas sp. CHS3-5 TaxID=3068186 RepID=UPI00273F6A18|nr:class I SAM-dependent methyltransferase [Oceanimonas sp. CHS3-5]MDP5291785.1 class I SAM-dependent methyltransferase [Oceanimonas sp. CHS3-5]
MTSSITLVAGREKSLLRRHPWVFSRAVDRVQGQPNAGDTVDILSHKGQWLGRGFYSPQSQIRARVWTFDRNEHIDEAFFLRRLERAKAGREDLIHEQGLTGYRLCAAESDGLPGVTIDVYANVVVCQLLSTGAERWRKAIVAALTSLYPGACIYERSDVAVRKKEGLKERKGLLAGTLPTEPVVIEENNGVRILIDVETGHKTGFYLDQRDNRRIAGRYCQGKRVLNCFSYTGTFGVYALKGGASEVVNADVSESALALAKQNAELNQLDLSRARFEQADVFKLLREYREQGESFDVIVLDPPKFAESKAQLNGACRGYKDINMLAFQLLNPGGVLLTFSCSGLMTSDLFQKIVADAALDAGRDAQILERLNQAADHPIGTAYPEGHYLKGLVVRAW